MEGGMEEIMKTGMEEGRKKEINKNDISKDPN